MRRVLLVEDSASMRAFVRASLSSASALGELEIVEAQSGFDALRLLPRGAWDLVITDINMPDINGLELISFIRKSEAHRTTPILIISTASSERDRERGMTLGASSYLVKPFTAEALVAHALEQLGAGPASGAHA
jgi:two-component system, chemotaxis family, chemotaxis protein CheY